MTSETSIDFDARYSVDGYRGIAFYLIGYATEEVEVETIIEPWLGNDETEYLYETKEVENPSMVIAVMVGDDRKHTVDVDDLTLLADEDYCSVCGQIGCVHDGR